MSSDSDAIENAVLFSSKTVACVHLYYSDCCLQEASSVVIYLQELFITLCLKAWNFSTKAVLTVNKYLMFPRVAFLSMTTAIYRLVATLSVPELSSDI